MATHRSTAPDLVAGYRKGRVPRSIRERQLLEVAERVFAVWGYQGASLEQVAREAGVTRQYLTKLFGDKAELFLACHARAREHLEQLFADAGAALSGSPTVEDAREVMRACVEAYFRFVRSHGSGWDVLFGSGAVPGGPVASEVQKMRFDTVRLLAGLVRRAVPDVNDEDAQIFAHTMSGGAEQLAKWWRQNPDVELELLVDRFVAVFWDGFAAFAEQVAPRR